jgi:hypothetical protein
MQGRRGDGDVAAGARRRRRAYRGVGSRWVAVGLPFVVPLHEMYSKNGNGSLPLVFEKIWFLC